MFFTHRLSWFPPLHPLKYFKGISLWLCQCSRDSEQPDWLWASQENQDGEKGIRLEVFELERRRISGLVQSTNTSKYSVGCQSFRLLGELVPLACWICLTDLVNGCVRTWRHSCTLHLLIFILVEKAIIPPSWCPIIDSKRTEDMSLRQMGNIVLVWAEATLKSLLIWKYPWEVILDAFWPDAPVTSAGASYRRRPASPL